MQEMKRFILYFILWFLFLLPSFFFKIFEKKIDPIFFSYLDIIIISAFFAMIFSLLYWVVNLFIRFISFKKMSMVVIFCLSNIFIILNALVVIHISFFVVEMDFNALFIFHKLPKLGLLFFDNINVFFIFYIFIVNNFLLLLEYLVLFIGWKNFIASFLGGYYHPKNERKIFLFIDLKKSTFYTENWTNYSFSLLMQECVLLLNRINDTYEGEIYRYLGDGMIIVWNIYDNQHEKNTYPYLLFYDFIQEIENNKYFFIEHFSIVPQFKAVIHCGHAIKMILGDTKKEISYFSDTLNTVAKMLDFAQESSVLLVSDYYKSIIPKKNDVSCQFMKKVSLKGKEEQFILYRLYKK